MLVENLMKLALMGASWVMYLLLLSSVLSIASMVERWWFFKKHMDDAGNLSTALLKMLRDPAHEGDVDKTRKTLGARNTVESEVVANSLPFLSGGATAFSSAIESELGKKRKELERGMNLLGTLGSNAPFIGLFGTVIGVIEAFHHLGAGQDEAAMANVMAGIAEALVATGVGLFVAIPAVVAYNYFQNKIAEVEGSVWSLCKELCAHLEAARVEGRVSGAFSIHPAANTSNGNNADDKDASQVPDHAGLQTATK